MRAVGGLAAVWTAWMAAQHADAHQHMVKPKARNGSFLNGMLFGRKMPDGGNGNCSPDGARKYIFEKHPDYANFACGEGREWERVWV